MAKLNLKRKPPIELSKKDAKFVRKPSIKLDTKKWRIPPGTLKGETYYV